MEPLISTNFKATQHSPNMKPPLKALVSEVDALRNHNIQKALLEEEIETPQALIELRQQMIDQDRRNREGIEEIQLILDNLLQDKVIDSLKKEVEAEVANQIDIMVQEQVALCLKSHIPQELQDDVSNNRRELERVRLELHNSESRRANSSLRSTNPEKPLCTIYRQDGAVSPLYPKDLGSLFNTDEEEITNADAKPVRARLSCANTKSPTLAT